MSRYVWQIYTARLKMITASRYGSGGSDLLEASPMLGS